MLLLRSFVELFWNSDGFRNPMMHLQCSDIASVCRDSISSLPAFPALNKMALLWHVSSGVLYSTFQERGTQILRSLWLHHLSPLLGTRKSL